MKYLIASDIHGSESCCRSMLQLADSFGADKILLLGDLLYHGPRNALPEAYNPKSVISLLNAEKSRLLCVRGNCDAEADQMVLEFPIMADYCLLTLGRRWLYATHGHTMNLQQLPPLQPGDVLLHGHTHIPAWETFGNGNLYLNPGSVSIPKAGSTRSCILAEDGLLLWTDLNGNTYHELRL